MRMGCGCSKSRICACSQKKSGKPAKTGKDSHTSHGAHTHHHHYDLDVNSPRRKPASGTVIHGHSPHAGCGIVGGRRNDHIPDDYLGKNYHEGALIDIGKAESFRDLEVSKDFHHPGFAKNRWGTLSYDILMERDLGESLIQKIRELPTAARLPEPCMGRLFRTIFRGYDVIGVHLTHSKNNREVIESCVRKLKAAGPKEFAATMTYYGSDPARRKINKKKRKKGSPTVVDILVER